MIIQRWSHVDMTLFLYSVQGGWKVAEVEYYQIICSPTDFLTFWQTCKWSVILSLIISGLMKKNHLFVPQFHPFRHGAGVWNGPARQKGMIKDLNKKNYIYLGGGLPKKSLPRLPLTPLFYYRIFFNYKNGDVSKKLELTI